MRPLTSTPSLDSLHLAAKNARIIAAELRGHESEHPWYQPRAEREIARMVRSIREAGVLSDPEEYSG